MKINNTSKAAKYKRIFFLVSVLIAVVALVLFLFDYTYYALACVGVFSLWYLYFHVADYQFIEFSNDDNKIVLRYYKAVKFTKGQYSSIEFPQNLFHSAQFQNSIFGKLSDLTLNVRTKRGVAEYPTVSLSAVDINDRRRIQMALNDISE